MIEKITLEQLQITGNYVLVELDPDYNLIQIKTQSGSIELQIVSPIQDKTQHMSVTGTILKTVKRLKYFGYIKTLKKGESVSNELYDSLMRNTMPYDVSKNVKEGDKVWFNYINHINAIEENRVIEIEGHGYCMLIPYETLIAKEEGEELIPLNGNVFIKRDQKPAEFKTSSGLLIIEKVNRYGSQYATIVIADAPAKGYIDGRYDDPEELKSGDKVVINPKFGYRIANDLHAGKWKGIEVIRRPYILAKL